MNYRIAQLQQIIERTDWDNELIRQVRKTDPPSWALVAFAAIYFGVVLCAMMMR